MRRVWTEDEVEVDGPQLPHPRHVDAAAGPPQQPHPPIWIGGNSTAAIRRAAERGQGWVPFPNPAGVSSRVRTPAAVEPRRARAAAWQIAARARGRDRPHRADRRVLLTLRRRCRRRRSTSCDALEGLGVTWAVLHVAGGHDPRRVDRRGAAARPTTVIAPYRAARVAARSGSATTASLSCVDAPQPGALPQRVELRGGAFAPAGCEREHQRVGRLRERVARAGLQLRVDHDDPPARLPTRPLQLRRMRTQSSSLQSCSTAVSRCTSKPAGTDFEEVAGDELGAVGDSRLRERRERAGARLGQIEHRARERRAATRATGRSTDPCRRRRRAPPGRRPDRAILRSSAPGAARRPPSRRGTRRPPRDARRDSRRSRRRGSRPPGRCRRAPRRGSASTRSSSTAPRGSCTHPAPAAVAREQPGHPIRRVSATPVAATHPRDARYDEQAIERGRVATGGGRELRGRARAMHAVGKVELHRARTARARRARPGTVPSRSASGARADRSVHASSPAHACGAADRERGRDRRDTGLARAGSAARFGAALTRPARRWLLAHVVVHHVVAQREQIAAHRRVRGIVEAVHELARILLEVVQLADRLLEVAVQLVARRS